MNTPFRGWWIVAVGLVAQAISIGVTIIPFGFFTLPLVEEFGSTRAEIQLGLSSFMLVSTAAGGFVGRLLDGGSIRLVMACGGLVMAGCFLAMSFATALWQLGALFGVGAAVGTSMAGPLPATTVIAKWFERRRGTAVGVASTGPLVGGALITPLAGALLESLGWRGTLQIFALLCALIVPLALWIVRNTPEEVGQRVDGDAEDAQTSGAAAPPGEPLPARAILGARNFWALALGVGVVFGVGGGWGANVPTFGDDMGYTAQHMSLLIGVSSLLGILSTLGFGVLADRFDNRWLLWVAIFSQAAALLVLSRQPGGVLFGGAVLLFGFAGGALLPVYAAYVGRLFGADSFGSVMGLAGLVMLPFGAIAPVAAGAARDATGSYAGVLVVFGLGLALGGALLAWIRAHPLASPAADAAATN